MATRARPASLAAAALLLPLWLGVSCGERRTTSPALAPQPATGAGMTVHRDPVTGWFGPPPTGTTSPDRALAAPSFSAAGLAEEPGPRGGVLVRLQGRFRSEVRAARAGDGRVTTVCGAPAVARVPR
jgi:hypothetical protein